MNLESIAQPIQGHNIEEHSELLDEKITAIKLEYVDRIFLKKIAPFGEQGESHVDVNDFTGLLNKYTPVLSRAINYRRNTLPEGVDWKTEMYASLEKEFSDKILSFYKNDHENWIQKTEEFLQIEKAKAIVTIVGTNSTLTTEQEEPKQTAGLIHYDIEYNHNNFFESTEDKINKDTRCMFIHLESLYKKILADASTSIFPTESFNKLAEQIVDTYSSVEVIAGHSWVMNTAIAKRAGFKVIDNNVEDVTGAFWGQFIDFKGQINIERVKKFLETGIPPYKVVWGYMKTEDFLKKYLPKGRRGKIILKEPNPEIAKKVEKDSQLLKQIQDNWDKMTAEKIDEIISQSEIYREFFQTDFGKKYLERIKDLKRKDKTIDEVNNIQQSYAGQYHEEFDIFLEKMKFSEKEVIIE